MSGIKHIYWVVAATLMTLLPSHVVAQNAGVKPPAENAMNNLFVNPEPWSGKRYSEPCSFADRLYINTSAGAGKLWEYNDVMANSSRGFNYHVAMGYKLSPVHALELGTSYNDHDILGNYHSIDLSYLFDVTAFASRVETPRKWQLLLKGGVDVDLLRNNKNAAALTGAARIQYNLTPSLGIYIEPKASLYSATRYSQTSKRGSVYTSASIGLSFNIGGIVDSYNDYQERLHDTNYVTIPFVALKTNLLFDALSMLNIELEFPIYDNWSIAADYIFPWWVLDNGEKDSKRSRVEVLNANIEGRYWFGSREGRDVLTGWFAGIYGGGGLYDVEYDMVGYQGEFFIAAGVSGGYSHKITRNGNFRMEYSLGLGYLKTDYRKYDAVYIDSEWHALRRLEGVYTWWGPTKAKVSLSWLWNRTAKRKGAAL